MCMRVCVCVCVWLVPHSLMLTGSATKAGTERVFMLQVSTCNGVDDSTLLTLCGA